MWGDCDVRTEWPGAMRRGHRIWIHPFPRCGSAAAIAIARSNAGFGECLSRQAGKRQGDAYRPDHPHPSQIEAPSANFSAASRFQWGCQNDVSGTASRATLGGVEAANTCEIFLSLTAWPRDTSSMRHWPRSGMFCGHRPFRLPRRSKTHWFSAVSGHSPRQRN